MKLEIVDTIYQEEVYLIKHKPIVVMNVAWENLREIEYELLSKIISALRISLGSVLIVSRPSLDISAFIGKTSRLIYFGELPNGVAKYEVLESGELLFICSDSLTQLLENEASRKLLWVGLKKMFAV
jgi:hypothetical protein